MLQIHRRHAHRQGDRRRRFLTQRSTHGTQRQRRRAAEQRLQRCLHRRFSDLGRQVEHLQIILVRSVTILRLQGVVSTAECGRRVELFPVNVAGKGARLPHQPADDVPIIDVVLILATQPRHMLHQGVGIPHFDLLDADAHVDKLADQAGRHRIGVMPDLQGASLTYAQALTLLCLQASRRKAAQRGQLRSQGSLTPRVALPRQVLQKDLVGWSVGKIPAAPQQQGLRHRLLETPVALFTIAVLVRAGGVGSFGSYSVMRHQGPVLGGELLGLAVRVHRQTHAVGTVAPRRTAQGPHRVLKALAQAGEALREAHGYVFPVRVRQHEVVQQMIEQLAGDRHAQAAHVREVRRPQATGLMDLSEVDLFGRAVLRLPATHPPLQRAPQRVRILPRISALQPAEQGDRLQSRFAPQHLRQLRPHFCQRIRPRSPGPRWPRLTGQFGLVPILPSTLAIHTRLHRRLLQRCLLVQPHPQFLHLGIRHPAHRPHWQPLSK